MQPALYIAYISGATGSNIILFYISDTMIAGVDAGTGKYLGKAQRTAAGGLQGSLLLKVPPNTPLITGGVLPPGVTEIPISFDLPPTFDSGNLTVPITTPFGPVNARFEKFIEVA